MSSSETHQTDIAEKNYSISAEKPVQGVDRQIEANFNNKQMQTGEKSGRGRGGKHRRGGRSARGFKRRSHGDDGPRMKRRRGNGPKELPFLLGGNIKDPLNLRSVKPVNDDEDENMKPIEIIIPKNIHDPLNLRNIIKNRMKRKRRNSRVAEEGEPAQVSARKRANTVAGIERRPDDPIVSPVPLSVIRKFSAAKKLQNQRMASQQKQPTSIDEQPVPSSSTEPPAKKTAIIENVAEQKPETFRFGNFDRYYGTRLQGSLDPRMEIFKKELFAKKAVLDIGCNVGYLTLSIAKEFEPRRIIGIDIDEHLIGVARKNIRHYCDSSIPMIGNFPASFSQMYGPISAPSVDFSKKFPDNVWFRRENYILDSDELLDAVHEEFDVILALSITKWIHLNWGDAGLKRMFHRAFRQLRPRGIFILEAQPFDSYKRRAKHLPETKEIYESIQFIPVEFEKYLLDEVGFQFCEHIESPKAITKGFERPIQIFYKRAPNSVSKDGDMAKELDHIPKTDTANVKNSEKHKAGTKTPEQVQSTKDSDKRSSKTVSGEAKIETEENSSRKSDPYFFQSRIGDD